MILITMTINSTDHYISTDYLALTHLWRAKVIDAGSISYSMRKDYGGYVDPQFGGLELVPDLFDSDDWPPPDSCAVTIEYTADTEANAEEIFKGTAHLSEVGRDKIVYDLYSAEYDSYLAASTAISDTLDDVFTTYCGAGYLNLTIDTTYARATSPAVVYTVPSRTPTLDVLSDIASFFSHLFYISGTTLYLVDMLLDNGTETLTEFDFFPSTYPMNVPYSVFVADTSTADGTYPYGGEYEVTPVCHGTGTNREAALANIKTIIERPRTQMSKPMATGELPVAGRNYSWTDESLQNNSLCNMWVRDMSFDLTDEIVTLSGDGAMEYQPSGLEMVDALEMVDDLVMLEGTG